MTFSNFKYRAKGLFKLAILQLSNAADEFFQAYNFILNEMIDGNIAAANERFQSARKTIYASLNTAAQILMVSLPILFVQAAFELGSDLLGKGADLFKSFFGYASEANDAARSATESAAAGSKLEAAANKGVINACTSFLSNLYNSFSEPEFVFVEAPVIEEETQELAPVQEPTQELAAAVENRLPKLMMQMFNMFAKHAVKVALEHYGSNDNQSDLSTEIDSDAEVSERNRNTLG